VLAGKSSWWRKGKSSYLPAGENAGGKGLYIVSFRQHTDACCSRIGLKSPALSLQTHQRLKPFCQKKGETKK